jgi:F420-dependent oxidoreductase-like protein
MDISIFGFDRSLEAIRANVARTDREGFSGYWVTNGRSCDALTALAVTGAGTGIRLGTAVVPVHPRHPAALAQQSLTANLALDGRLVLGVGVAHRFFVEGTWGLSFDRPVSYLAEYLEALLPLLHERKAAVTGERVAMNGALALDAPPCPVVVAALGPRMLELAGRLTSGTITWMVGVETVRELTAPVINEAAAAAGRDAPEVVAGVPVCVTNNERDARARSAHSLRMYGDLPSYRTMLDREGLDGPGDMCVIGAEDQVAERLAGYFEAGATSIAVAPTGTPEEVERTRACLASLVA